MLLIGSSAKFGVSEEVADTPLDRLRRAPALVREYVPAGVSLANELIEERRRDGESAGYRPQLDWEETRNRGRAVFRALAMAEAGIDRHGCGPE